MSEDRFFSYLNWRLGRIVDILGKKGKEYSTEDNKLHNFDRGAVKTGKIREEIILDFMLKHQISVDDIVENIKKGILAKEDLVEEKIGDIINYYILLEASIKDRIDKEVNGRVRESEEVSAV